jgi:hypothetical protein
MSDPIPARRLAGALEPVIGSVYFAPECHRAYEGLGFDPSTRRAGQVELPDGPAYFTSRGSCLGQVPGQVVTAAFGVFSPAAVVPSVTRGWQLTDPATIAQVRIDAVAAQLERILGPADDEVQRVTGLLERATEPLALAGRPLYAGLRALGPGDGAWARLHRAGDLLREFRGDSHNASWISAGLSAPEIGLLTEGFWSLPARSYVRTRAWTDAELDEATERLRCLGWLEGDSLTDAGRAGREGIEADTDRQLQPAIDALGDDLDGLVAVLLGWGGAVRAAGGYLSAGPHDLARAGRGG